MDRRTQRPRFGYVARERSHDDLPVRRARAAANPFFVGGPHTHCDVRADNRSVRERLSGAKYHDALRAERGISAGQERHGFPASSEDDAAAWSVWAFFQRVPPEACDMRLVLHTGATPELAFHGPAICNCVGRHERQPSLRRRRHRQGGQQGQCHTGRARDAAHASSHHPPSIPHGGRVVLSVGQCATPAPCSACVPYHARFSHQPPVMRLLVQVAGAYPTSMSCRFASSCTRSERDSIKGVARPSGSTKVTPGGSCPDEYRSFSAKLPPARSQ